MKKIFIKILFYRLTPIDVVLTFCYLCTHPQQTFSRIFILANICVGKTLIPNIFNKVLHTIFELKILMLQNVLYELFNRSKSSFLFLEYKYVSKMEKNMFGQSQESNPRPRLNKRGIRSKLHSKTPALPTALTGYIKR